ncbi:MAG: DNA-directed RNA polymerase subunit alpha [bacterium]|nr:DNA-directed RNA polymerase subunit alpha [bacterium]
MENLLLPTKVEFSEGTEIHTGHMVIMPCYHGYGTTLGNAFRRVLLSSLPGAAVEAFKIKGVQHEFTTAEGVKEDGVELTLNLKQLSVKVFTDEPVVLTLTKKGPGIATAGDITPNSNVEIINKDLVIATLTGNKTMEMEIVVARGRGFKTAEEKDRGGYDLGTIVIDSVYSPIRDVGYDVEYTRVGDITNYEKLTINIETDGTMTPREAIRQSTQILMNHFNTVMESIMGVAATESVIVEEVAPVATETTEAEVVKPAKKAKKKTK